MTELDIQNCLYREFVKRGHRLIVPNSCVCGWEADLISVTKAGFIHECEIKITASDFRADGKKKKFDDITAYASGQRKHRQQCLRFETTIAQPANFFWYAVPTGLVTVTDLPGFAGLIYVEDLCRRVEIVKKAPRLHRDKIAERHIEQLTRNLMIRYWRTRFLKMNRAIE